MTELLPSLQAAEIRRGLVDYLTTTFALADAEPRRALGEFLEDSTDGIFKGPYVRLRLPFAEAAPTWGRYLDLKPPFPPYRHQAEAYRRLTSADLGAEKPRPLPTIVTTGTGSGKTEAFLHPILDHVRRARERGEAGMKALILYPMNALADDQAGRLTQLLTSDPQLSRVTAGLYTGDAREGQAGEGRTRVTPEGLITNRSILRDDPPDILLTNYKMLDQLLLRPSDQPLWAKSALSLTYLVLDEFHTYDGAQGTDVAMLLRRLGLALRDQVPADHPERASFDARPLGRLTPVATSATLGDRGDPERMLSFAQQVFGEVFPDDSVITETRVDVDALTEATREALGDKAIRRLSGLVTGAVRDLAETGLQHRGDGDSLVATVIDALYDRAALPRDLADAQLLAAHPDVRAMVEAAGDAIPLDDLRDELLPRTAVADDPTAARGAIEAILAALSHVRLGHRDSVSVEVTMWVREVTRVDRLVSSQPSFRWGDDGQLDPAAELAGRALPAIYCRACGRSGWGATLASTGRDLADRDESIRRDHLLHRGRFRALLHAPGEASLHLTSNGGGAVASDRRTPNLRWLHMGQRTVLARRPADDDPDLLEGDVLPVLMLDGETEDVEKRAQNDECPSCGKSDSIRFLGSAIATLLSVSLSTLFGDRHLDPREKRALVFTDSVQDAAHRAGFVDHRSHAMSLRAALREALTEPTALDVWVDEVLRRAEGDAFARYRLVPAAVSEHERFAPYWRAGTWSRVPTRSRTAVRRRLLFDAALEVGLQSTYGRTLEATGSVGVHVSAGPTSALVAVARRALAADDIDVLPGELSDITEQQLARWVRGSVEHLRRDGAIDHEWLKKYVSDDGNRVWIWGRRRRDEGAPSFPRGRSAPAYAVAGGPANDRSAFVRVTSSLSWYARWAQKCLGINAGHGAAVAARLLAALAQRDVLTQTTTDKGGKAYGIPPTNVVITPLSDSTIATQTTLLVCDTCRSPLPVSPAIAEELLDGPCPSVECVGALRAGHREADSFYRRLFETTDMRRVDAREHTSLLLPAERREIEAGFKRSDQRPGDPNVLVATPTLEMGIDIGDLTTVMLSSLPDSVAKYLQRVGRAGRLTGSSLALAYVTGRGEQLPRLGDPTSMINGEVRPPATYLDAEEILRRQFLASVIDGMVRDGYERVPRRSGDVLASADPGTLLGDVIERVRVRGEHLLDRFVGTFDDPATAGLLALRRWALPDQGDDMPAVDPAVEQQLPQKVRGVDTLEATIYRAVQEHTREVEEIRRQRREIEDALPELREAAERTAATEDDRAASRSAKGAIHLLRRVLRELTEEPWITGLEIRGLLPNYSLLDDSVELDAQVSWMNPETQQYDTDPLVIDRGSARALTELAPGAYFYARGLEMRVDGVEIGRDDAEVRLHAACDSCGYVCDLGPGGAKEAPRACPRCGSTGIADMGQRFEAVRLKRVFSDIRRDDARIGDDSDERRRTPFEVVTAVDFDPALCEGRWSVARVGLGVAHYRRLPVRWWNLGRVTGAPTINRIAGRDVTAQKFRICEACGKLDKDAGSSSPSEHRAWCRHRHDDKEHTRLLALGRELVTQGVAISLPLVVTDGLYSLPGLSAALLLGLHKTMGGAPDHLRVEIVPHPVGDGGQVLESLFLHDTVPGGTGYLTDLASPDRLWGILVRSAQVLEKCPCQDEARASCYRCLLPFVRHADQAHRVEALRALKYLLQVDQDESVAELDPDQPRWSITHGTAGWVSPESPLEQKLRLVLKDRLGGVASVRERPGSRGTELIVTGANNRTWTLAPQVDVAGTRPDFVLSTPGVAPIAIYADGRAFHATQAHNAIADDARKREALRASGYQVIAVTAADLDQASPPGWLNEVLIGQMMALPAGVLGAGVSRAAAAEHKGGPLALLEGVIQSPEDSARLRLANAAPLLLGLYTGRGGRSSIAPDESLVGVALGMIAAAHVESGAGDDLLTYRIPHLTFAARLRGNQPVEMALVVDDTDEAVGNADHEEAWREWLRLSNLLGQSDVPCTITSRSDLESRVDVRDRAERSRGVWEGTDLEGLDDDIVQLARELSAADAPPASVGEELDGGVAAELSWPAPKVAVVYAEMPDDDVAVLRAAGWVVHRAQDDVKALADEVRESLSSRDKE